MKKNLILVLAAVFAISALSAQVSTDPTDEFYDLVERWEIMGIISEQPPLRPYPLKRVEAILSDVIEGDNEEQAEIASDYYTRTFRRPYKFAGEAIGNFRAGDEDGNGELDKDKQILIGGGIVGDYAFPQYVTAGYSLNLYASTSEALDSVPLYTAQPYYFHDSISIKNFRTYWIMDSNFAGGNENIYAQMGVNHLSFGPFYKNSAVVSPDAKHTANFSFVYAGERLSYTQALFGLSASNAKNSGLFSKKFLTVHSLNGQIFPWLNASFYEATIYGDRFEPAYIIPMPFIITQGLSGFDDNTFMGLSFTVRPVPGFVWVNDLYVDDMGLADLIKLDFDTKLRGTFQSAFKYAPAEFSWLDKAELRYTLVSPYMYTHKQNIIDPATGDWKMGTLGAVNYQDYTTDGKPLGLSLPPNTEQVALSVSFTPVKRFKFTARGSYTRHCNVNESPPEDEALSYLNSPEGYLTTDGSIRNHQHYLKDGNPKNQGEGHGTYLDSAWDHFLFMTQETKMQVYQAGFDVDYTLATSKYGVMTFDFGYTFEHIVNAGVDRDIFRGTGTYDSTTGNYQSPNKTAADVEKALADWRAALYDITNHYVRFGLKLIW